ncbi:hypothetical protein ACIBJF_43305 [Streptomyces sp. NPDC050743]|uniref:hypothetical protein n=1 Tax=Streptomyces sp. NPDC050743 TaxID=3365634 RepID=UPI00378F4ACF
MLSIATIAFILGLLLPRGIEALGAVVAFVIAASILNGSHALHAVQIVLPVHYWQDWTHLFDPSGTAHLGTGIVAQVATITLGHLRRRPRARPTGPRGMTPAPPPMLELRDEHGHATGDYVSATTM